MAPHNVSTCKHGVRLFYDGVGGKKAKKIAALRMTIAYLDGKVKESERKARTEIGCEEELFFEHDLLEFLRSQPFLNRCQYARRC